MRRIKYLMAKFCKKVLNTSAIKNSKIDPTSKICSGSNIVNLETGKYSYLGNYCLVVNADLGSFCSVGDYCYIGGAKHAIEWVSTSPVFHSGKNVMKKNFSEHKLEEHKRTIIGNDVWIGSMCLIKEGVHIGNGAVIGMGSVVTKDVAAYTIVAGNPAKLIRKRFSDDVIDLLETSKWWLLDDKKLKEVAKKIKDINRFIEEVNRLKT